MRASFCLVLLVAGCTFPDLAKAPETPSGPPPRLAPLEPLVTGAAEPEPEADAALQARAAALRARAAALPEEPIEPDVRERMLSVGEP